MKPTVGANHVGRTTSARLLAGAGAPPGWITTSRSLDSFREPQR